VGIAEIAVTADIAVIGRTEDRMIW